MTNKETPKEIKQSRDLSSISDKDKYDIPAFSIQRTVVEGRPVIFSRDTNRLQARNKRTV